MSSISVGTGLISGINTAELVDSLIAVQRRPVQLLELRAQVYQQKQTGLKTLEANVLSLATSIQTLKASKTFNTFAVTNSAESLLKVTTDEDTTPGTFQFQAVRKATTFSALSKGFANTDQQTIGTGTIRFATGGGLNSGTLLDALNGGQGVQRGTIRITDRSGNSADVDLSDAYTVNDVISAINGEDISVVAHSDGGSIVLTDTSGSTGVNLQVTDLNGGQTAEDLGIAQSVAADTLTGDDVYQITGDFTLGQINDGNGLRLLAGAPDIRITLTDDTEIEVNLDGVATVDDVLQKINDHEDNGGKLSASLVDGHFELEDLSGGGGTSSFTIEDINSTNVIRQLGLDTAAAGTTITGNRLAAGLNSVLLRNLRGGQGFDEIGQLSLTDRTGTTTTIDLTGAESLDEVINAINAAEDGGTKLQLTAAMNETGTGIEITDTSGSTASNLIIADVSSSTLATQLGIAVDAAQDSIDSGSLGLRYVNEATSLDTYAPDGGGVEAGSFVITDSAGRDYTIAISSAVENIGDALQRINIGQRNITGSEPVLLANLNDGEGIDQLGEISLTDRAGETATIDLSSATTLEEVIDAINAAESAGSVKLQLTAQINDDGNGIEIVDTSGSTASNLVISDVGGSTLADQLGIAVDTDEDAVDSGSLEHRSVYARLNDSGDGIVLIDNAGGSEDLLVEEVGSTTTAADLRILGTGVDGGSGQSQIVSQLATTIEVESDDTLDDLVEKINAVGGFVTASIFDDGSAFNSKRLSLKSTVAGSAGRLIIEQTDIDLNLSTSGGQDALLRIGGDAQTGFLVASDTNKFEGIVGGIDVNILKTGNDVADVTVTQNQNTISSAIRSFVTAYNSFVDRAATLTKFDLESNERGVLQGDAIVLRVRNRLDALITKQFSSTGNSIETLVDLGVRSTTGGKLQFDEEVFTTAFAQNAQDIEDFFLTEETGFAAVAESTLESLTDSFTGTFALETNSLQTSIDSLNGRIEQLDEILEVRRTRLLQEFVNMENILSQLTSQQQTLSSISSLRINPIRAGL